MLRLIGNIIVAYSNYLESKAESYLIRSITVRSIRSVLVLITILIGI